MSKDKINSAVDSAFDSAFSRWSSEIERELYPDAFSDENSWLHVKNSIRINNSLLKEALKQTLSELAEN